MKMDARKLPEFPREGEEDKSFDLLKRLTRATSGTVPVLGPFLSEVIDFCFVRPIEKRREEWFAELDKAFRQLAEEVDQLTPSKLAENEEFITLLHRATDTALRTHQFQKRVLLRNAVLSSASATAPDLDRQTFFLRLVDDLTVNQVLILLLYDNPLEWFKRHGVTFTKFSAAARIEVLNQAYPEIVKTPDFRDALLGELGRRGLLHGLGGVVTEDSVYAAMTTDLGHQFLQYVKADSITG